MKNILKKCNLCHHNCNINRYTQTGYCNLTNKIKIAKYDLTYYEEPCISNTKGSGTIFFSGCNIKCCYCQNIKISRNTLGYYVSIKELANIMLKLQEMGAININLVTPTPQVIYIIKSIKIAKKMGLKIPIIYNTSTYENIETIKLLKGLIDVYLPDLKYYNDQYAYKYSKVNNYFFYATNNIKEMYNQVGNVEFDQNGNIIKGVIVRHLMLPNLYYDTKKIIKYLYDTYQNNIYISIMNQYTIMDNLEFLELKHNIKKKDYENIIDYALSLGIKNAYIQEDGTNNKEYIPDFN